MKIQLCIQGGSCPKIIVSSTDNNGIYNWLVNGVDPRNDYYIKLSTVAEADITANSAVFTILNKYVTVLYPNGGETFSLTRSQEILQEYYCGIQHQAEEGPADGLFLPILQ